MTRILVVEDHRLVAEGLQTALRLEGFDVTLAACGTAAGILEEARAIVPELVLLDLELADAGDGRDLIRPLVELGANVLLLTGVTDRLELAWCVEAGAIGIASKAEPLSCVLEKVHQVANGESVMTDSARARFRVELRDHRLADAARAAPFEALTTRERHVLAMIVEGRSARSIAIESFVSLATIRTQIRSVLAKLGVNSQNAAAALARAAGWPSDAQ